MKPFKQKKEIQEAIEGLWAVYGGLERGAVILWRDLHAKMGCHHDNNRGKHIINQLRKRFKREKNIVVDCEPSVGLRLLTEDERATVWVEKRMRRAWRQSNRAYKDNRDAEVGMMSDHARRLRMMQDTALSNARRAARRGLNVRKKTETNPQPKLAAGA